ncbi:MAG: metallophosphoesterase [Desulfuromonadaceae bacterium]|nr:metallophosphoesterase [Desulfuromonadaceae bacterium]
MTIIPLLVRAAEQFQMERTAFFFAWPGYLWMGFLFIFCSTLLFSDIVHIFYRVIIRYFTIQVPEHISKRNAYRCALVVALCASIYAFIEAGRVRTEHVVITSSKLSPSLSGIRIVQISDLHIGLLLQKTRLQRVLATVREAKPDILVSTGDLVDGKLNRADVISGLNPLAALIAAVPAPSGKFAIIGNHEVYAGLPQAVAFSRAAGFMMLRNQSLQLTSGITISGVDDRAANFKSPSGAASEAALLNSVSPGSFHLLLKHRPEILAESDGRFDLQLSGHVHGGQIFPFNFIVRLRFPIPCGTSRTPAGSSIHVSRGTGTWGPPMRLFAPPEITVIDIISAHHR